MRPGISQQQTQRAIGKNGRGKKHKQEEKIAKLDFAKGEGRKALGKN